MRRDEVPPIEDPQVADDPPLAPVVSRVSVRRECGSEDDGDDCAGDVEAVDEVERAFLLERGLGGRDAGEPIERVAGAALEWCAESQLSD